MRGRQATYLSYGCTIRHRVYLDASVALRRPRSMSLEGMRWDVSPVGLMVKRYQVSVLLQPRMPNFLCAFY